MTLEPTQAAVLDDLIECVDDARWCVFGSVDSVLRGVDEDPSDVDVLATEAAAARIRATFPSSFVETRPVGESFVDEYRRHGEELEVIYGDRDGRGPLVDLTEADLDRTSDRGVPLLSLSRVVRAYRDIGYGGTAAKLEARLG